MSLDPGARIAKQRRVDEIPFWWHSVDLGDGVVTPGHKTPEILADEWHTLDLAPLVGCSVLDIGAWDGYFSFTAEAHGAARVVALDHFVWALDHERSAEVGAGYAARGLPTPPLQHLDGVWDTDGLPGKRGFDLCHELRTSRVEAIVADFDTADLDRLGRFDVVLYLGVLYHEPNPMRALGRLRQVTGGVLYIESEMMFVPGRDEQPAALFFPGSELHGDVTNWWVPNDACLAGMCLASGFSRVDVLRGPPADWRELPLGHEPVHYRGTYRITTQ